MASTVLTLVGLRFRILGNALRRSPVQLVAVILGALQVLGMGAVALVAGWLQGFNPLVLERQAPQVVVGAIVTLVWVLAPIVIGGAEPALDPRKLARFGVTAWRLLLAELLVGVAWFPALATLVAALALALTWRDIPAAAAAAVAAAPIVLLTCVIASRAATALAAALVARYGAAGRVLATLLALVVLLGPVLVVIVVNWPPWARFVDIMTALAWTPLGAAWAIGGFVAAGSPDHAVAALVIALLTIAVLLGVWWLTLRHALATRPTTGRRRASGLGVLGVVRTGATGAIYGRSLVLWFRDPRLVIQLAILPVVPILLVVLAVADRVDWFAYLAAPLAAGLLPLTQFAGISYDGPAFASELAAAVRGRADRIGRAGALLTIAAPVVVLAGVLAPLAVGSAARIPAVVGLALAALLVATAVSSVSSAFVAVPVPASGKNPFAAPPGSNTVQIVGSYVVTGVTAAILAPVLAIGVIGLATADAGLGWWTLGGGLLWGVAALSAGVAIGARRFDGQAPALLERLRRARMR